MDTLGAPTPRNEAYDSIAWDFLAGQRDLSANERPLHRRTKTVSHSRSVVLLAHRSVLFSAIVLILSLSGCGSKFFKSEYYSYRPKRPSFASFFRPNYANVTGSLCTVRV